VAVKGLPGGETKHVGADVLKLRALKLSKLLLALNDLLLNNDCLMQHCSDPRLISLQLCHAALMAGPSSALFRSSFSQQVTSWTILLVESHIWCMRMLHK
jgi:hypothetical protein